MKNWFNNISTKYPILKYLGNKYVLLFVFFVVWIVFLDNQSYLQQRQLNKQIDELENNQEYYQTEINKDKKSIENLKNSEQIEKYAREKYFMKKDSEDIYIIDIEDDRIKDSILEAEKK